MSARSSRGRRAGHRRGHALRAGAGSSSAWASRPSEVASAIDVLADLGERGLVDGDDVDVLEEVVDAERAGEAGRAVGGQHVVGPGEVVADRRRGVRAAEHRAGVAHAAAASASGSAHEQLEVLGGDGVGDLDGLLGPVAQHRVAALGEGGLEVRRAAASAARCPRRPAATPSATASSQVMSQARPSGPCSAWSTTSMAAQSTGVEASATTTTSDGPGERAGHADEPGRRDLALGLGDP